MKTLLVSLTLGLCALSGFSQHYHWKWAKPANCFGGLTLSEDSVYYWHSSFRGTMEYQSYSFTATPPGDDITLLQLDAKGDVNWGKQAHGNFNRLSIKHAPFPSGVALLGHSRDGFTIDKDTIDESTFVLVFNHESDNLSHYINVPPSFNKSWYDFISFDAHKDSSVTLTFGFNDSISIGDTTFYTIGPHPRRGGQQGSLLLKYSYYGELLWTRKLGDGQINPYDHVVDEAGDMFILGTYSNLGAVLPVLGNDTLLGNGLFLAKISATNEILWIKTFKVIVDVLNVPPDVLHLEQAPDGTIMMRAHLEKGSRIIIDGNMMGSPNTPNIMLAKLDAQGGMLWTKFLDLEGTIGPFSATMATIGPNNQIAIAGNFKGTVPFGDDTLRSDSVWEMFVVIYDSTGKAVYVTMSDTGNQDPRSFSASASAWGFNHLGELILTGYFGGPNLQLGSFLIEPIGQFPKRIFIAALAPGSGPSSIAPPQSSYMTIAPNPAKDHIRIRLSGSRIAPGKPYTLSLYDMQGRRFMSESKRLSSSTLVMPVSEVSQGMYIVELMYDGQVYREKLILLK